MTSSPQLKIISTNKVMENGVILQLKTVARPEMIVKKKQLALIIVKQDGEEIEMI
jgi:hypothetical protein